MGAGREFCPPQLNKDKKAGQEERFARFMRLRRLVIAGCLAGRNLLRFQAVTGTLTLPKTKAIVPMANAGRTE